MDMVFVFGKMVLAVALLLCVFGGCIASVICGCVETILGYAGCVVLCWLAVALVRECWSGYVIEGKED